MRNARAKLSLLVVAVAWTVAQQGYSVGMDGPGLAQPSGSTELVLTEAEPLLTEAAFAPCEFTCLPAPFASCHRTVGPAWYVQIEGMALKRDASGDRTWQAFVDRTWSKVENPDYHEDDPAPEDQYIWEWEDTVTSALRTQDLHFGFQTGGRALVGRTLGACHAFEVSYFDVTDWNELAAVRDATEFVDDRDGDGVPDFGNPFDASLFSPFSGFGDPPIDGLDYNGLARISYTSSLDNLEWNLRRWILYGPGQLQASVLVGGRYMNIDERFGYHTESTSPANASVSVATDTENSMLGAQIGAMFEFFVDPGWWIDCEIKGGVFSNEASQRTVFTPVNVLDYPNGNVGRRDENITSWVLDLRLNATVLITPRLAVIGGYHALWLDGLALASENMSQDVDVLASGPALLVDNGKVVYHGPHLGLSWVW